MENDKRAELELPEIVLASGSPRRSEILDSVGWAFEKIVPDIDESEIDGETPGEYVTRLAVTKAEAIAKRCPGKVVLGADTTVVIDGAIIGKPVDSDDARRMITGLSGRSHDVLTGVALSRDGHTLSGIRSTNVLFSKLNSAEIEYLVEYGSPLDKAGAYAVQAQAALFIEQIEGDYWNVVGLPISLVYSLFNQLSE
jgi:septum formation protein